MAEMFKAFLLGVLSYTWRPAVYGAAGYATAEFDLISLLLGML